MRAAKFFLRGATTANIESPKGLPPFLVFDDLDQMGYRLIAGSLPDGSRNEIAISKFLCETFCKAGYAESGSAENGGTYQKIQSASDMVGKTIRLGETDFTVSGVIDTQFDEARYLPLLKNQETITSADQIINYVLYNEFSYAFGNDYTGLAMVGKGYLDKLIAAQPKGAELALVSLWFSSENLSIDPSRVARFSDLDQSEITGLVPEQDTLGEKDIIVSADALHFYGDEGSSAQIQITDGQITSGAGETLNLETLKAQEFQSFLYEYYAGDSGEEDNGYRIVGLLDTANPSVTQFGTVVVNDNLYQRCAKGGEGVYVSALGAMPKDKAGVEALVSYCYADDADMRFQMNNPVTYELDSVNDVFHILSKWFLYIGLGFAVFSAIMLANFIATSISYKKQEIGILRAIGSRSNDVFRIFFAESFIIALINFLLASVGTFAATAIINHLLRTQAGILITVLNFGLRQVLLLLAVSLLVAFVASFFPVKKIASKRPIDAIRNR